MRQIIIMSILFCTSLFLHAQNTDCKVLMPAIAEEYKGECKNGLAHGEGVAKGKDVYSGTFKKGFPHKKGKYTWSTGDYYKGTWKKGKREGYGEYFYRKDGKQEIMAGYWKDDQYIGESRIPPPEYKIIRKYNMERVRIAKNNDNGDDIRFSFDNSLMTPTNIMLMGNSGVSQTSANFIGFTDVSFPFTGSITFQSRSKLNATTYQRELEFTIDKPGNWTIFITN